MAHTYTWTDEHGLEQTCDGPEARRLRGQDTEIALLRRERALLIDLEKARAGIIGGLIEGAIPASLVDDVARLNAAAQALHLEASGGIERPPGSPCRCVLCAPREKMRSDAPKLSRWVAVMGGGAHCSDGCPHRPSLSQSGGLIRCSRCGMNLRQEDAPREEGGGHTGAPGNRVATRTDVPGRKAP